MEITATPEGPVLVISIVGDLDMPASSQAAGFFDRQLKDGHTKLVADLGALASLSTAGLKVLLTAAKEARRQGGDVRLAAVQSAVVNRALRMSGFSNILKVYPDIATAAASFAA